jgi:hypothetical protein
MKIKHFPSFGEFMIFSYNKYGMLVHKDIRIVFISLMKKLEIILKLII